jgi:hypothetical protein
MLGSTTHALVVSVLELIAHARAMEGPSYASFRREGNIYEPVLRQEAWLRVRPKAL